jgi:pimeloyl-ACP methyl ester carboxylesterase
MPDAPPESPAGGPEPFRTPCPAPARILDEIARYDAAAQVGRYKGPRYQLTYRILGQGPPLLISPGIASTYRIYALLLNLLSARFRTIIYDYPGEHPDDGASLSQITHKNLVDDLIGLIDHLNIGRAMLFGISFGSTVTLAALHREPRRFPRAAVQGAFARRRFSIAEKWALRLGRLFPGTVSGLPFHQRVLTYNHKADFPAILEDRWRFFLEQNGVTPIRSLAHRVNLLAGLDLTPMLTEIPTELLLIHGNEDRIVSRRQFDELEARLPHAKGVILPTVGHVPLVTHAEVLAGTIGDWLLPCPPAGCSGEQKGCAECPGEQASQAVRSE